MSLAVIAEIGLGCRIPGPISLCAVGGVHAALCYDSDLGASHSNFRAGVVVIVRTNVTIVVWVAVIGVGRKRAADHRAGRKGCARIPAAVTIVPATPVAVIG